MANNTVTIAVKKRGFFRAPKLDNGTLTHIGNEMVAAQKARWARSENTDGTKAKPLSKKYIFQKAKVRRTNRPVRDLHLSGLLLENFTLRKAINGHIRANPTARKAIDHARLGQEKEAMIGFAPSDSRAVAKAVDEAFGELTQRLWKQIG